MQCCPRIIVSALATVSLAIAFISPLQGQELLKLEGHEGAVQALTFSPDGSILASGSDDGTIKLWDVRSGELLRTLWGHVGKVYCLTFSPDGTRLASAGSGRVVRLWEVSCAEVVQEFRGHRAVVKNLAFSADGHFLASTGGNVVKLWDTETGEFHGQPDDDVGTVLAVAFLPDDEFVTSSQREEITIWKRPKTLVLSTRSLYRNARANVFSKQGNMLALAHARSSDIEDTRQTMRILNVDRRTVHSSTEINAPIMSMEFSPDERLLAIGTGVRLQLSIKLNIFTGISGIKRNRKEDFSVRVWDIRQRELLHHFEGHTSSVISLAYSPDGTLLASGSRDRTIRLWKIDE